MVEKDHPSVVVLGGGMAGMSTAHELMERGKHVTDTMKRIPYKHPTSSEHTNYLLLSVWRSNARSRFRKGLHWISCIHSRCRIVKGRNCKR